MNMSRSKLLKTGRLRDLRPNTFSWWRRARFSTSREELERNRPTSADQMSFSRSHIEQFIARFGAAGQVDRIYDSDRDDHHRVDARSARSRVLRTRAQREGSCDWRVDQNQGRQA